MLEKEKALDYYHQSLTIRREVGDRRGEAITLSNIGMGYSRLGKYQNALDTLIQSLAIQRACLHFDLGAATMGAFHA